MRVPLVEVKHSGYRAGGVSSITKCIYIIHHPSRAVSTFESAGRPVDATKSRGLRGSVCRDQGYLGVSEAGKHGCTE